MSAKAIKTGPQAIIEGAPILPPTREEALQGLIVQASKVVPSWVVWLAVLFGGPSLGGFYVTAQAVWGLPSRVAAIEEKLVVQQATLDRIEVLLKAPASRP